MKWVILAVVATGAAFGGEAINPSAEEVEYERVIAVAKAKYDAEVGVAKKKLAAVLEIRKKTAMISGNLALANELDQKIKSLIDVRPEDIFGIWKSPTNRKYVFNKNMTVNSPNQIGTWKIEDNKIIVDWGDNIDMLTLLGNQLKGVNKDKMPVELLRLL